MKQLVAEGRQRIIAKLAEASSYSCSSPKPRIERVESLVEWMKGEGAEFPYEFEVKQFGDGEGIGIFALEDIPAGEDYCSIPDYLTISERTLYEDDDIGEVLRSLNTSVEFKMLLYSLYHKFYTKDPGYFAPYFDSLPSSYFHIPVIEWMGHKFLQNGFEFNDFFLPLAKTTVDHQLQRRLIEEKFGLFSLTNIYEEGITYNYHQLCTIVSSNDVLRELFFGNEDGGMIPEQFKFHFLWTQGLLFSHSYTLPSPPDPDPSKSTFTEQQGDPTLGLFPFFDTANTSDQCEQYREYNDWRTLHESYNNSSSGVFSPGCYSYSASSAFDVGVGDEILALYGSPNFKLFTLYGFVLPENPNDELYINDELEISLTRFSHSMETLDRDVTLNEKTVFSYLADTLKDFHSGYLNNDDTSQLVDFLVENEADPETGGLFSAGVLMKKYLEFQDRGLCQYIDYLTQQSSLL